MESALECRASPRRAAPHGTCRFGSGIVYPLTDPGVEVPLPPAPGRSCRPLAAAGRDPEIVEDALVLPPVRRHLDDQVEEHPGPEELLDLQPRRGPDPLDHVAAFADQDRL